jgi:hypothetical protein
MRNSSAFKIDEDFEEPPTFDRAGSAHVSSVRSGLSGDVLAVTARRAGRLNAASVSTKEYQELLAERQALLDKKFSGKIERREELRLEYVRWSLDRVEDARHGEALERLESAVMQYEQFLHDLAGLREQLNEQTRRRRK